MVNNGGNIAKLADKLSDERHAALITSDISRRYFCGFTSSAGIILVTKEASYLLIDFRYFDKAKERVSDCEVILLENAKTQLMNLLIKHGITTVSVESDAMTVTELEKYKANYTFVTFDSSCGLSEMIGKMRIIKTPEEIEKIVKAQRIAERAFSRLLRDIKPGQTEKHVAALLEYYMADLKRKKANHEIAKKDEDALGDMKVVQEMYARGFEFMPIDIYKAKAHEFQIIDNKLMPSLDTIEGLGEKAADGLVEAVANQSGPFVSKNELREKSKLSKTVIETMSSLGLLEGMPEDSQLSIFDF